MMAGTVASPDVMDAMSGCAADAARVGHDGTLVHILKLHAARRPTNVAYNLLGADCAVAESVTYQALDACSEQLARQLGRLVAVSSRAILVFPQGLEFIVAYFACLKAGVVAVPVSVPSRSRGIAPIEAIVADSDARLVLTTDATRERIHELFPSSTLLTTLTWLDVSLGNLRRDTASAEREAGKHAGLPAAPGASLPAAQLAMLQYTSGSTGRPKGVAVSHRNLVCNQRMIQRGFGLSTESTVGTWLPLYHDMGLIGTVLQTVYLGAACYLMSPAQFVKRPSMWLQMITRYGITVSGCPNFGYEACISRISDRELAQLDLGHWRVAFSGAEPVRANTLERFAARFAEAGFDAKAFMPCYGLAETTLYVCGKQPDEPPTTVALRAEALEQHNVHVVHKTTAVETEIEKETETETATAGQLRRIVSCGRWPIDAYVRIVDPESRHELGEDRVGEIWVSGPHVADGYWRRLKETQSTFQGVISREARREGEAAEPGGGPARFYLRTGDLGFVHRGELYVTGRLKDMIIINGKNIYPGDIESLIESGFHERGISAVAAFHLSRAGGDRAVIVAEVSQAARHGTDLSALAREIKVCAYKDSGAPIEEVLIIRRNALPRTTSGKLQRSKVKELYTLGEIQPAAIERTIQPGTERGREP